MTVFPGDVVQTVHGLSTVVSVGQECGHVVVELACNKWCYLEGQVTKVLTPAEILAEFEREFECGGYHPDDERDEAWESFSMRLGIEEDRDERYYVTLANEEAA